MKRNEITEYIDSISKPVDLKPVDLKPVDLKPVDLKPCKTRLLNTTNFNQLKIGKFSIDQIKYNLRHYNQRVCGKKDVIIHRLYNFLRLSFFAIQIQSNVRRLFVEKYNRLKGFGLMHREKCMNDADMVTLECIGDIDYHDFISFTDTGGKVWGFELCSLINLFKDYRSRNTNRITFSATNPYNRENIDHNVLDNAKQLVRMASMIFNYNVDVVFDNTNPSHIADRPGIINSDELFRSRLQILCNEMDELGNYTSVEWFATMNRETIISYLRKLRDVWEYRSQLSVEMRCLISPPYGRPFGGRPLRTLNDIDDCLLRTYFVEVLDRLIMRSNTSHMRNLGSMYVLMVITLVNSDAAESMPALHYSVSG